MFPAEASSWQQGRRRRRPCGYVESVIRRMSVRTWRSKASFFCAYTVSVWSVLTLIDLLRDDETLQQSAVDNGLVALIGGAIYLAIVVAWPDASSPGRRRREWVFEMFWVRGSGSAVSRHF